MKNKGKYLKDFALRGLVGMGFGPLVLAVVYAILGHIGVIDSLSTGEVALGIISNTILAFLCGAVTQVYHIEELPISKAITIHGIFIYIAYATVYIVNDWLADGFIPFVIFSLIFVVGYLVIWCIIYFIIKKQTQNVNIKLKNDQNEKSRRT